MREKKEQEQLNGPKDDEKKYVYAIVAIILIMSIVVIFLNNGRVTDVENLDERVAKVYDAAAPNAIQRVFEKEKNQYEDGSAAYDAER